MLCSALSCFPIICHSKPERVKTTGIRVAALTLDSNHTISVSASGALHRYAIRDPESSLILSLYALVDVLVRLHEMDIQLQIRTMNNAKVILVTYDEFLVTNNRGRGGASRVPFECWVAMRHHLESVCLLWLCHPESFVRREAWSLLKIWESDGLRQLEQSPTAIGQHSVTELQRERRLELLADYLKPDPSTEANLDHCPELYSFLKKHYQLFKGVIAWAWSFAVERMTFVIENDPVHCKSEQYALWRNHLQFVCLGVRAQSASFVECTTAKIKVDYNTKRESLQSQFSNCTAHVLLLMYYCMSRCSPVLHHTRVVSFRYYDIFATRLHSLPFLVRSGTTVSLSTSSDTLTAARSGTT